ncbi:hypothetical protein ACWERY_13140 [Streptomyces sp. NPDC004082]
MVRNVLGSVLALLGAAAAVWSPFRAWYDGRHGRYYRLGDLFSGSGVTDARADLFTSLFLPFAIAAVVTVVGVLLRSRLLVALAGISVLAFAVLWMVRIGQAESGLTVDSDGNGLGAGVAGALGGGVLLLIGAALMRGRGGRRERMATLPPSEPAEPSWQSDPAWNTGAGGQHGGRSEPTWQQGHGDQSEATWPHGHGEPSEPTWQHGPAGTSGQDGPYGPTDPTPDRPPPREPGGTGSGEDAPTATWRRPPDQR